MVTFEARLHTSDMDALPIFYSPSMVADSESYSPSAAKPAQVVASWQRLGVPLELHAPPPVTPEQLALAHDADFVRDVLAARRPNGFGSYSRAVAATLPYTSGAMLAAARHALERRTAAVAPCSGFHHAGWDCAGAFCTFIHGTRASAFTRRAPPRRDKPGHGLRAIPSSLGGSARGSALEDDRLGAA